MLTKALSSAQLHDFCCKLGVCHLFQPPTLRGDVIAKSTIATEIKSNHCSHTALEGHANTEEAPMLVSQLSKLVTHHVYRDPVSNFF